MGMGYVKFHTIRILWEKLIYSHTMGFEWKSIELKNPHNSQIWETSFHRLPNVWEYFFPNYGKYVSHSWILIDFSCVINKS